jgi:fatty-acyl-CoA synthase
MTRGSLLTYELFRLGDDTVYLWTLPLFHVAGWTLPWSLTLAGATNIILRMVRVSVLSSDRT